MCVCVPCASLVLEEGRGRRSDPLELDWQAVWSSSVGAGNPGPLQEQPMLFASEQALQLLDTLIPSKVVYLGSNVTLRPPNIYYIVYLKLFIWG